MAEPPENWANSFPMGPSVHSPGKMERNPGVHGFHSVCLVLYTSTQTPKSSAAEPGISGDLIQHGSCHLKHPLDQKKKSFRLPSTSTRQ